ncbi:MAG: hypothetical protein RI988_3542 [Pseudomonadota bacterium]|jgi:hypothetical protein
MSHAPLSVLKHVVNIGVPLPFDVLDSLGQLLLARGQVIESHSRLETLCVRGSMVDLDDVRKCTSRVESATPQELPGLWVESMNSISRVLRSARQPMFRIALDTAAKPVLELVARDPDLALFQILRQDPNPNVQYGVDHSVHCAIVARLVAQRLGWSDDECHLAFKAALTMNLSMLELQGVLALRKSPPNPEQREAIRTHPLRSREMLEAAEVTDADWLRAVEEHHERPDGSGYPGGRRELGQFSELIRRVDIYCAKLSSRASREAIQADRAGREMFMSEPNHPMVAAIVKEFGIYPPGCFVRLESGEQAIVVRRGAQVHAPVVTVLTLRSGELRGDPVRCDTSRPGWRVKSIIPEREVRVRLPPQQLMGLVGG